MAARGLVNGRGPRSGRDLVFRCYPPELLLTPKKTEADLLGQPLFSFVFTAVILFVNIKTPSYITRMTLTGHAPMYVMPDFAM